MNMTATFVCTGTTVPPDSRQSWLFYGNSLWIRSCIHWHFHIFGCFFCQTPAEVRALHEFFDELLEKRRAAGRMLGLAVPLKEET
jgi:hypothetical protein